MATSLVQLALFVLTDLLPPLIREFVGPITGGGLTDLLNFRATASVSEKLLAAFIRKI